MQEELFEAEFFKIEETGQKKPDNREVNELTAIDEITAMKEAYKIEREIHRLLGLLRFSPTEDGVYVARCSPDHFILPVLAEHFTLRFGKIPWVIIDEKRSLCLCGDGVGPAKLFTLPETFSAEENRKDSWEDLWRLYHKSINNESRSNPRLQCQFMPKRYQKYLTELQGDSL